MNQNDQKSESMAVFSEEPPPNLECGTSLVEDEHFDDDLRRPEYTAVSETNHKPPSSIESLRELLACSSSNNYNNNNNNNPLSTFVSPYGTVPLVYCDHTASNRPHSSIERYIETVCLPLYGNTHTNTSITGSQSTAFVAEARQIVAEETNAKITGKASLDVVLFTGNGATSAVELLIDAMGLKQAAAASQSTQRPVIMIGPYEHHSNLIPWRETGCEIIMIPECSQSRTVDIKALEKILQKPEYKHRLKMGTFSAASNVTGKLSDVDAIAAILHRHGALAFFDYATAAPYVPIDMNPVVPMNNQTGIYESSSLIAKDAVFISPHKMLGGIGTSGILIVKKHLVSQVRAPSRSGGGTVFYVTSTHHRFLSNRIERYEGGTPNVIGIVRVGLTFLLKRQVEEQYRRIREQSAPENDVKIPRSLMDWDCETYEMVALYLKENAPNLILLGEPKTDEMNRNLPIFSFLIRFGKRFLHYNYVCAILNDVFGIQSRGGCQCAGPYSQRLLGLSFIDEVEKPTPRNEQIEDALYRYKERAELLRPGYTRLSLPFKGLHSEEVEYVLKALAWVSQNGWALMCQYRCNHRTGEWRHSSRQGKPLGRNERKWLSSFNFTLPKQTAITHQSCTAQTRSAFLGDALKKADHILVAAKSDQRSIIEAVKMADSGVGIGVDENAELEELRWFVYPKECAVLLSKGLSNETAIFTDDTLGALKPQKTSTLSDNREVCVIDHERHCERKRKTLVEENVGASHVLLSVRDGDYTGEATFSEICEGINDGELSLERCQIYDKDAGLWLPFQTCQGDAAKKSKSDTKVTNEDIDTKRVSMDHHKKGLKKESRTSAEWGKQNVNVSISHEQDTNSNDINALPSTTKYFKPLPSPTMQKRFRHTQPPAKLMRAATQAIMQWEMIKDGDKLLLGLSGGKDSLSLLHCLLEFKRKLPFKFEIEVCTIDPMTPSFDPSPLIPYVESLGLKYHYIRDEIVSRAMKSGKGGDVVSSLCAYCARMKRGNLYSCARNNGCNKLVLAQHLDDCAESLMMSIMHNGFLRTMKANYPIDAGDIFVIRPLIYCRESLMTDFAKSRNLPVINENCPACFEEPKERARIKKLLNREETLYPNFFDNIRRSLIPLMHDDMSAILRSYTEEVVSRSKKKPYRLDEQSSKHGNTATVGPWSSEKRNLGDATDEELLREITRRRIAKYKKNNMVGHEAEANNSSDPTGQTCSLLGGNGSIPCRELME